MYVSHASMPRLSLKIAAICLAIVAIASVQGAVDPDFVSARVESCRGCSLNRLPDVKKFIYNDLPSYERVEFKPISGAPPELVLLNINEEEVERIPLSQLTRDECNELLVRKGFNKLEKPNSEL